MRKELIHILSKKDRSHSELLREIPRKLGLQNDQLKYEDVPISSENLLYSPTELFEKTLKEIAESRKQQSVQTISASSFSSYYSLKSIFILSIFKYCLCIRYRLISRKN